MCIIRKFVSLNKLYIFLILFVVNVYVYFFVFDDVRDEAVRQNPDDFYESGIVKNYLIHNSKCSMPNLDPWTHEAHKFIAYLPHVKCSKKGLLTYIKKNETVAYLSVNKSAEESYTKNGVRCCVSYVTRRKSKEPDKDISFLNISRNCDQSNRIGNCGCDYVWIFEPPYEAVSGKQFCGQFTETNNSTLTFKSQTRSTTIRLFHNVPYDHAFTLKYFSERNRHFIDGYPKYDGKNTREQYLTSPFFPKIYPSDLSVEYVISCKTTDVCRIRLIFTDFQVSKSSLIEFYDWNDQRIFATTGSLFRPPVVISTGPALVIRFYANGGTNLGYKASYELLVGEQSDVTNRINTDCGGYVDNLGGGITMMNMVEGGAKNYDCLWIIKPPQNYFHMKTHLYAKVTKFEDFAGGAQVLIREGLTSNEPVVEILNYPQSRISANRPREHVVSIAQGFYIRMKGNFRLESTLEIVYAAFSYKGCSAGSDFLCKNQRCVPELLECDGFDQCGDSSDEPQACLKEPASYRFTHLPNFYFPNNDRYLDLKTATIIFIISSLALVALIISLIVLLYRINTKGSNHRHLQTHLQTINDLLEEGSRVEEEEIIIADDPPVYEAPPEYTDIMRAIFESDSVSCDCLRKPVRRMSTKRSCQRYNGIPSNIGGTLQTCDSGGTSVTSSTLNLLGTSNTSNCLATPAPVLIPNSPPPTYISVIKCVMELPSSSRSIIYLDAARNISDCLNIDIPVRKNLVPKWPQKGRCHFRFSLDNSAGAEPNSNLSVSRKPNCLSDSELLSSKNVDLNGCAKSKGIVRSKSIENLFSG